MVTGLARAVRISGDGGQEGRHLALPKKSCGAWHGFLDGELELLVRFVRAPLARRDLVPSPLSIEVGKIEAKSVF